MKTINRREFCKLLSMSAVAYLIAPMSVKAVTIPEIVVVGGGFSGSTCAKYLKLWGGDSVSVTIVESNTNYISPILSNLVLNGKKQQLI